MTLVDATHLRLLCGTWLLGVPRPCAFDWKLAEYRRTHPPCDRCVVLTAATEVVVCAYGCRHWQCARCAAQTRLEANDWNGRDVGMGGWVKR